jgi:hypothetical protein
VGVINNSLWQLDFVSYPVIHASYFTQITQRYEIAKSNLRTNRNKTSWNVGLDCGLCVLYAAFSERMKNNKPFTVLILL